MQNSHFRSSLRSFLFPLATGVLLVAFPHILCAPYTSLCTPPTGNLSRLYKPDTSIGLDWTDPRTSHKSFHCPHQLPITTTHSGLYGLQSLRRHRAVLDSVSQHTPFFHITTTPTTTTTQWTQTGDSSRPWRPPTMLFSTFPCLRTSHASTAHTSTACSQGWWTCRPRATSATADATSWSFGNG